MTETSESLRMRIEEILRPAIDVRAPYAKQMVVAFMDVARFYADQRLEAAARDLDNDDVGNRRPGELVRSLKSNNPRRLADAGDVTRLTQGRR